MARKRTVRSLLAEVITLLEQAAEFETATDEERAVARQYADSVRQMSEWRIVTRKDIERVVRRGFQEFNTPGGKLATLLDEQGMEAVQAVFRRVGIAARLRDEALAVLEE